MSFKSAPSTGGGGGGSATPGADGGEGEEELRPIGYDYDKVSARVNTLLDSRPT